MYIWLYVYVYVYVCMYWRERERERWSLKSKISFPCWICLISNNHRLLVSNHDQLERPPEPFGPLRLFAARSRISSLVVWCGRVGVEDIHQAPRLHPAYLGAKRQRRPWRLQHWTWQNRFVDHWTKKHQKATDIKQMWSTSPGEKGWNPQHSPNRSHSGHDLFCHASWLKIHLQNTFSWSNTDETYQPLRPCDILWHFTCISFWWSSGIKTAGPMELDIPT